MSADQFRVDCTLASLEDLRRKLRGLISLIEKKKRATIITDFSDETGDGTRIDLRGFTAGVDVEKVREKALLFLRRHEEDVAIHKLRWNEPLTSDDLQALEMIFASEGSSPEEIEVARSEGGLGLFVRSLVGLDREAAKRAFSSFSAGKTLTANQLEFVNLVINYLTSRGWMDTAQLYTSPFIDQHPSGVDGIFDDPTVRQLLTVLTCIKLNATAPVPAHAS